MMTNMRSYDDLARARVLFDRGLTTSVVSRELGIPRTTVRDWRHGRTRAQHRGPGCPDCAGPAHDFGAIDSRSYAYLLGQYLGDGCLIRYPRAHRLQIACCDDYPGIKDEVEASIAAVLPTTRVGRTPSTGCTYIGSYSKAWPCLFPQHGSGRKHEREIRLTDWQIEHCEREPGMLLRGLIHSDGSRCINRVTAPATGKCYAYPRYFFDNRSDDILLIFGAACDRVGVRYRWGSDTSLSVARRADVAVLDRLVGPKT